MKTGVAPYTPTLTNSQSVILVQGLESIRKVYEDEPEVFAYIVRALYGVDAVVKTGEALLEKIGMVPGIEKERKAFIQALQVITQAEGTLKREENQAATVGYFGEDQ